MLQDEITRLQQYSAKKNQNSGANALYTSGPGGGIDAGFLEAKIIKHAFSSFPKIKTGGFSKLSDEEPDPINYGLDTTVHDQAAPSPVIPAQETTEDPVDPAPEAFGGEQVKADEDGVVVEDPDETF